MDRSNLKISPYRISTMVITGNFGTPVNLQSLFQQLSTLLIPIGYPSVGILKMEHRESVVGASARDVLTHRRVASKTFFNQSTLVIRQPYGDGWKEANLKMFANGGFQMTGIPTEAFARATIEWLLAHLTAHLKTPVWTAQATLKECNIQLLNSDYSVNATILRNKLHKLLTQNYRLFSTYESTIYQGVNTKFFFNTSNSGKGICQCEQFCKGQGTGHGEGECKRITMSIFRTGRIIITGARKIYQIEAAYDFLNTVFDKHHATVLYAPNTA